MANAHLPNNHKDVTPDWKPFRFPRTPFSDLFKLNKTPGQHGDASARFTGSVPPYYCSFAGRTPAVHGGVSATLSIKAAQLYHKELYKLDEPLQPLTLHIEFLKPAEAGLFQILVKHLPMKGRQACFHVSLQLPDSGEVFTSALVRLGKLQKSSSSSRAVTGAVVSDIVESYQQALPEMPDRTKDCARGKFGGPDMRYTWFKPDDGELFRQEHVPVITDLIGGIPLNFEKNGDKALFERAMPTMSMHLTFRADVTGEEFLLCQAKMKKLQNGWFDMDMLVLNDGGEIVATCVQTLSYIPIKRLEKEKGGKTKPKL